MGNEAGFLGVLMLDTRFPRLRGDVGHPDAFGIPTRRHVVKGAFPARVVANADALRKANVLPAFAEAARELEREGARAITTSCGFLVLLQQELQECVRVPVVTSSLLQVPALLKSEQRVGVLTISAERLDEGYLRAAGVPEERIVDVVVEGVDPAGEFARAILENRPMLDVAKAEADVIWAAHALHKRAPDVKTVVLECTNMPPYAEAVQGATGLELRWLNHDPVLNDKGAVIPAQAGI